MRGSDKLYHCFVLLPPAGLRHNLHGDRRLRHTLVWHRVVFYHCHSHSGSDAVGVEPSCLFNEASISYRISKINQTGAFSIDRHMISARRS